MNRTTTLAAILLASALAVPASATELFGRLAWGQWVELATPLSGRIAGVHVAPGQRVSKGDLLVELDSRVPEARFAEAQAVLRQAEIDAEEAERELERTQEMYDRTLLSEHERQLGEIAAERARAALSRARAAQVLAGVELEYARLRAPFDGLVTRVGVRSGEVVVNNLEAQPLVTLAERGRMRVQATVDPDLAASLAIGEPAEVVVRGRSFQGTVVAVGVEPVDGPTETLYPVEVLFQVSEDLLLRAGEQATVRVVGAATPPGTP